MKAYIYGLKDPKNNLIRYIGQTMQPPRYRFSNHLSEVKNPRYNTRKINWLKSLLKDNVFPALIILEETTKEQADDREKYWIRQYKQNDLTNLTEGGNDVCSNIKEYHRRTKDKKVYSFNEWTKEIKEYSNVKEASIYVNCKANNIPKAIHIKGRCSNLFWSYDLKQFSKYNIELPKTHKLIHVTGNNVNILGLGLKPTAEYLGISWTKKNSLIKVLNKEKEKYLGYIFEEVALEKLDELLESCDANQQPSLLNLARK